jgi:hypothetical protein
LETTQVAQHCNLGGLPLVVLVSDKEIPEGVILLVSWCHSKKKAGLWVSPKLKEIVPFERANEFSRGMKRKTLKEEVKKLPHRMRTA